MVYGLAATVVFVPLTLIVHGAVPVNVTFTFGKAVPLQTVSLPVAVKVGVWFITTVLSGEVNEQVLSEALVVFTL